MNKAIIFLTLGLLTFTCQFARSQTDSTATTPEAVVNKPVRFVWESGYLIDQQTGKMGPVKTLEAAIEHKFGTMDKGFKDLYGIYAPGANIRLALDYVIAKNVQLGYGIQKKNMYSDFNAKWTPLHQMNTGMPITLSFYGNLGIDGREQSVWTANQYYHSSDPFPYSTYSFKFSNRLSYFSQMMVAHKFCNAFTLQLGASFSHFNTAPWHLDHDKVGLHAGGRVKISPQGSFIFNCDLPLQIQAMSEQVDQSVHSQPILAFGFEVSTSTHAFQIYVGNNQTFLPQDAMMNNQQKVISENFCLGFAITRLWGF